VYQQVWYAGEATRDMDFKGVAAELLFKIDPAQLAFRADRLSAEGQFWRLWRDGGDVGKCGVARSGAIKSLYDTR
jgi:hypothetical protein